MDGHYGKRIYKLQSNPLLHPSNAAKVLDASSRCSSSFFIGTHAESCNFRHVLGRHFGEGRACRPVGVLHVKRVPPLEVVEGASWSRASWRVQQENDLLRGHAIFTRDVVNHLSPNYALRKIGHPAPVLEDGLQQQAALLFGPVQAMFPSKP